MMKKNIILCLFSLALLSMSMVSCGGKEPESAQELYEKIDEEMNALESYRTDVSVIMTFFVSGKEVKGEGTGYIIENDDVEGDYYFCQDMTTKVTCEELSMDETTTNFEAYYNGNYFISNGDKYRSTQKLYSPMTAEDALKYRLENDMDNFDFVKDCTTKNFDKREDGTWELTCSGYTKVAIEKISEAMGLDNDVFSLDVMDMKVVVAADANYLAKQVKIDFVFEQTTNMPAVSYVMNYSQHNEAEAVLLDYLNVKKYTKVDDIRVLRDVEKMLEARTESESGEFMLEIRQTVEDRHGEQLSAYTEGNSVSFGEGDDGYFYDIAAVINQENYRISYKNGTQTVKQSNTSQDYRQTEQEARDWIKSLLNISEYSSNIVTDIEDKGNGVYVLTCDKSQKDVYEDYFQSSGGSLSSFSQTMTVTIKDGRITEVLNSVEAQGTISSYGTVTMTQFQTVTFQ